MTLACPVDLARRDVMEKMVSLAKRVPTAKTVIPVAMVNKVSKVHPVHLVHPVKMVLAATDVTVSPCMNRKMK